MRMTFTEKQIQTITAVVAIKAYEKMNRNWRIGDIDEISKTESKIWKACTFYEPDGQQGNTLIYFGEIEDFSDELEKLLDSKSVLDCQVAAYTAFVFVVKRIMGEKFKPFCKYLYEQLSKHGIQYKFFYAISDVFRDKDKQIDTWKGAHVYVFNVEEHDKYMPHSAARGIHLIITNEDGIYFKFIGYHPHFKNGPLTMEEIAHMMLMDLCSNKYLKGPPPKELEIIRELYKSNFWLFASKIEERTKKLHFSEQLSAKLINDYLENGKLNLSKIHSFFK